MVHPVVAEEDEVKPTTLQGKKLEQKRAEAYHYHFAGPPGAFAITALCLFFVYGLYFGCNEHGCHPWRLSWTQFKYLNRHELANIYSTEATLYLCAYMGALIVARYAIPAPESQGVVLRNGQRLWYKHNAFETFIPILGVCAYMTYSQGWQWSFWTYIWDHYIQLVTAAQILATVLACTLYFASFRSSKPLLAEGGDSGNILYDWFIGRELNPRIGSFDIKVFSELRPGLIGWVLLNLAFAAHQHNTIGRITDSMILVNIFQFWYVADALYNESAILTTMDVITDGLGYMLCMGNIVWVPFTYSLQARYLASHPVDLGPWGVTAILLIQALGYTTFRGANGQKNAFRNNPDDPKLKHLKYIETKAGKRLLISGWWGVSRHINYLGDWTMAWAWCLPCAFSTAMPYYYVIYFAILLIHRERRDEGMCMTKYGEDWKKYKSIVRSRIIPGLY